MAIEPDNDDLDEEEAAPKKKRKLGIPKAFRQPLRLKATVRVASTIAVRDLVATFQNPTAYGLIGLFLAGCGLYFFVVYDFFGTNEATVRPLVRQMPLFLAVLIPILTMRSVADEKRNGTMNWLQSLPVTDGQIVIGKFIASAGILFGILFTSGLFPVLVAQVGSLDGGQVLASYIGLFLVGCAYASLGILASALTTKPSLALLLGIVLGLLCYGTSFAFGFVSPELAELFSYVSFKDHFLTMERGVLDSRNLLFYLSVIFVALVFAKVALGKGRSSSKVAAPIVIMLAGLIAVGWNLGAANLVGRVDLTRNSVNTLSLPALDVVSKFAGLNVNLFISPDLPDVLHDPVTGGTTDMRVAKQRLLDLLEEFRANAKGRMWVNTFTRDLEKEAKKAGIQPLYDRGRDDTYYFGATFKFGDVVETLPSVAQAEFQEFDITNTLIKLRKRAIGFKKIQEVRNAAKTVHKATTRCLTELQRSVTPIDQLPADKRVEPLLSRVRIAEYTQRFRYIKDRCHWLGEVSKTISVYAQRNQILEQMRQASIEGAELLRVFERQLSRRGSKEKNPLAAALSFRRGLKRLQNLYINFEASPGRKTIGIVCSGTSLCPFRTAPRFSEEEMEWLNGAPTEFRAIGEQFVSLSADINDQLEDIEQDFFRRYGMDIVPIDLSKPIPEGIEALVLLGSVGPSSAFRSSTKQALHKFTKAELYRMDQFLLDDGALAVFLNPWNVALAEKKADGASSSELTANKSNIDELVAHYGIEDTRRFIVEPRKHGQLKMQYQLVKKGGTNNVESIGYPLLPTLTTFNEKHPIARGIEFVHLPFATALATRHPKAEALLLSSRKSVEAEPSSIPLDPQALWSWAQTKSLDSHDPLTVAASLEGRLDSYFKKPPPSVAPADTKKQHVLRGQGRLLVVGSNLGLEPLHYDTIFGPEIRLTDIPKDPERHKFLIKEARRRLANWTQAMTRLEPVLGASWTGTPHFFRNSLDWLVQGKELDNVDVKLLPTATLDINPRKDRGWPSRIRAIAIGAGPLLLLIVGLLVWLTKKRRRKWIVQAVKRAKKPVAKAPPKPPESDAKEEKAADEKDPNSAEAKEAQDDGEASSDKTDAKEALTPDESDKGDKGDEGARPVRDTDENPQVATSETKIGDTDENPIAPSKD